MVPIVLLLLTGVALVAATLAVASGRLRVDGLAEATTSTPDHGLGTEPEASDVDSVHFDTAPRGYRPEDVDARLDALRDELADRERELARLRDQEA
ncbi:DivIVA domain-containing protein [Phycicoccus sp. CSK15P-2]|uniref:DivIVA domain-containing protein n=1 Tax=Phycicoccus sp. CSK15P-2 TaxID=2807627 RepID=UPI001950D14E|nr:DivIVA domain-containing protein [Phycicoccus sp. CSK15P-2]MBM6405127.1 DivIVA domain-containing protein [Phycicoccus sp. CSK15P-2]